MITKPRWLKLFSTLFKYMVTHQFHDSRCDHHHLATLLVWSIFHKSIYSNSVVGNLQNRQKNTNELLLYSTHIKNLEKRKSWVLLLLQYRPKIQIINHLVSQTSNDKITFQPCSRNIMAVVSPITSQPMTMTFMCP